MRLTALPPDLEVRGAIEIAGSGITQLPTELELFGMSCTERDVQG